MNEVLAAQQELIEEFSFFDKESNLVTTLSIWAGACPSFRKRI